TQLILNVKQLRLTSHNNDPIRMRLTARGEGIVTAADIQVPSQVDLLNPELPLLTLDSDESEVEVELTVQKGRGYSPAEERTRLPIDEIPVDAIFSPIRRVRFEVERERFDVEREHSGAAADYDRLLLSVWTDGTIRPDDALSHASDILLRHFQITTEPGDAVVVEEKMEVPLGVPDSVAERLIDELGLHVRAYNCLKRAGISTLGEVLERLLKGPDEMLAIRNFGEVSLTELVAALEEKGYGAYVAGEEFDAYRPTEEQTEEEEVTA
ncbi:MAG: DNA-directed RNA polymerase subunit alpha, partial [Ardenticatenaceae bacterium]